MTFDEKIIHIGKSANGKILSEWLRDNGYMILQPCGGRGTCGKCLVKVINGVFFNVSDEKYAEPDENGCVKACQVVCTAGGADIQLPLHEASGLTVKHETENIKDCSFATIRKKKYSAALDIGTTTLAMALVDLDSGNIIDSKSCLNPQHSYGADVISRISACSNGFLDQLRACVLSAANSMLNSLLYGRANSAEEITVAGNTTMLHIFCGISPVSMGTYPFSPVFKDLKIFSGDSFGLRAKKVTVLPSVSAFIGADIVSGLVFTQLDRSKTPALFIDIGTNGEMVLWSGEKLISASAAAGPALEGGNISCGTGGIPGAVCKVYEKSEGIVFKTICDKEPSGICGSGLIDLISLMLNRHILDETGSLDSENFRLCGIHEKKDMSAVFEPPKSTSILITQKDIRELQLAKSAIRAGIETLAFEAGIPLDSISKVYIAGGMGFYMDTSNAVRIGMLPEEFAEKSEPCGNTALSGAILCLTNPEFLSAASEYALKCETLELNSSSIFSTSFVENMMFPEQ